jgi:hypothetical protein
MLHEQTKEYILGLGDAELLEYVLTGRRMYEPEAIAFAQAELDRRTLPAERMAALRPRIVDKLADYDSHKSVDLAGPPKGNAILCEACGFEVPNGYVEYRQNIGAIMVRFTKHYKGRLCKRCNRKAFWKTTAVTFFLGWWGTISFFVTPVFLIANLFNFLRTASLPRATNGSKPHVDEAVVASIAPYMGMIAERVATGADISDVSREIAPQAKVTPGQVYCVSV